MVLDEGKKEDTPIGDKVISVAAKNAKTIAAATLPLYLTPKNCRLEEPFSLQHFMIVTHIL